MPTSPRPYKNKFLKNSNVDNLFNKPKSMTRSQRIEGEKKDRLKNWVGFYRENIHIFAEHYFKIKLYPFQIVMLWALQKSSLAYIVASRAVGKSFMIAVFSLCLAVLYPGIKIVVASKTLKQASIILDEKLKWLQDQYPMVAREIKSITVNNNGATAEFHCGSIIRASVSSENARGGRCNFLILEESRMVPKEALEQVLKPFLNVRTPPFRMKDEYKDDLRWVEEGRIAYITSAWYIGEYWHTYVKSCVHRMISGDETATFLAFDYKLAVYHGIKTEEMLKNEMDDNDPLSVQMEYLNIPSGSGGKSHFPITLFKRNLKSAFYPQKEDTFNSKKNPYDVEKVHGEIRFITCDIATRDNKANDNSIIGCVRAIPLKGVGYKRQLLYLESHKGNHVGEQAKRLKQICYDFGADYLVLDIQSAGIGVFDYLSESTMDEERGITYDALTVVDSIFNTIKPETRKELLDNHTRGIDARPVVFPILASQSMNSDIATLFRSALQRNLWEFLIADNNAEEFLLKKNKEFQNAFSKDSQLTSFFINPYVQTNLLVGECVNLDRKLVNGMVKLIERPGAYKDRYSAISYVNYIISKEFDLNLVKQTEETDDLSAVMAVSYW